MPARACCCSRSGTSRAASRSVPPAACATRPMRYGARLSRGDECGHDAADRARSAGERHDRRCRPTSTWLARTCQATVSARPRRATIPFPGHESFGFVNVEDVPGFDAAREFPAVRGSPAGARLFKVVRDGGSQPAHRNALRLRRRDTDRRERARHRRVRRRRRDPRGRRGRARDRRLRMRARHPASVLVDAAGALGRDPQQHRRRAAHGAGGRRIALAHVALSRLLRLPAPDPAYPFGVRLKRLPDWTPGQRVARGRDDELDPGRPQRQPLHERVRALHAGYRASGARTDGFRRRSAPRACPPF